MIALPPGDGVDDDPEDVAISAREAETMPARVMFVRELMLADRWHKRLLPVLAGTWGLSEGHVRHISAEASRANKAALNKPLLRARFLDKLERAYGVAEMELACERGSPAKASEAMTKAVLAAAQISGVATEEKAVPHLTINVGQPVSSPIMDELMGADEPKAITVHGEPVPEADAAVVVSAGVGTPSEVSDDDDGRDEGVAEDPPEGPEDWR